MPLRKGSAAGRVSSMWNVFLVLFALRQNDLAPLSFQEWSDKWAMEKCRAAMIWCSPGEGVGSPNWVEGLGALRRWNDQHRALWTHLRESGVTVHVAVITRSVAAQRRPRRLFATWLERSLRRPADPEERGILAAADADLDVALATANPRSLERWGGLNPCRRLVISLRERTDPAAAACPSTATRPIRLTVCRPGLR